MCNPNLHPPLPVQFQADNNWNIYLAYIEQYFLAYNITNYDRKRAILLTSLSFEVFSTLWEFYYPENLTSQPFEDICEVLKALFPLSVYDKRSKFYYAKQQLHESVMDFVVRLIYLTEKCEFIEQFENVARDEFIYELLKGPVFNKLIQLGSAATFEECVRVALEKEVTVSMRKIYLESNQYFESCKFIGRCRIFVPISPISLENFKILVGSKENKNVKLINPI